MVSVATSNAQGMTKVQPVPEMPAYDGVPLIRVVPFRKFTVPVGATPELWVPMFAIRVTEPPGATVVGLAPTMGNVMAFVMVRTSVVGLLAV